MARIAAMLPATSGGNKRRAGAEPVARSRQQLHQSQAIERADAGGGRRQHDQGMQQGEAWCRASSQAQPKNTAPIAPNGQAPHVAGRPAGRRARAAPGWRPARAWPVRSAFADRHVALVISTRKAIRTTPPIRKSLPGTSQASSAWSCESRRGMRSAAGQTRELGTEAPERARRQSECGQYHAAGPQEPRRCEIERGEQHAASGEADEVQQTESIAAAFVPQQTCGGDEHERQSQPVHAGQRRQAARQRRPPTVRPPRQAQAARRRTRPARCAGGKFSPANERGRIARSSITSQAGTLSAKSAMFQ